MKGTIKKLNLQRETLRELGPQEAQAVEGGFIGCLLLVIGSLVSVASTTLGSQGETCPTQYCNNGNC